MQFTEFTTYICSTIQQQLSNQMYDKMDKNKKSVENPTGVRFNGAVKRAIKRKAKRLDRSFNWTVNKACELFAAQD